MRLILVLIATGVGLGLLCGLTLVVGLYFRKRWIRSIGPFLVAAAFVGAQSWLLPTSFADLQGVRIDWRSDLVRILCGIALSVPGAWAAVTLTLRTAAVQPYGEEMRSLRPHQGR
ncbi:MAG: hypothetical protein KY468_19095, partial [Armatimonadetes bacterium]|nr:hypothetical protein [Armatimonadota bacterium]